MPVTVKADWDDGPTKGDEDTLRFNVQGATTNIEAGQAVYAFSPIVYNNLIRDDITVTRVGPFFHKVAVSYSASGTAGTDTPAGESPPTEHAAPATPTEPLGAGYEFSFSSEMTRTLQSIWTRYRRNRGESLPATPPIGNATDHQGAIGVSVSGGNVKVEGCEVPTPAHVWSVTRLFEPMTLAFQNDIEGCVGKKNAAVFYNSQPGEVVLWGASGRNVQGSQYSITYTFHKKRNKTNFVVSPDPADPNPATPDHTLPNALVIPAASGWDHIWVEYEEDVDTPNNRMIKRPISAHCEVVIFDADFSKLRIGA